MEAPSEPSPVVSVPEPNQSAVESEPMEAQNNDLAPPTNAPTPSDDEPVGVVVEAPPANSIPPPPPPPPQPAQALTGDSSSQMKVPRKNHNFNSSPQDPNSLVSTISKTVIPAKVPSNNNYYGSSSSTQAKIILPPLHLPKGVQLPPTMDPAILLASDRAMALLNELSPSQTQAALNEFDEAMRNKGTKVRNAQAYLVGVIKRYLHVNRKERSSASDPAMGKEITPVVKASI